MSTRDSLTTDHHQTISVTNSLGDCSDQNTDENDSNETFDQHNHPSNNDKDIRINDNYMYFKEKFQKIKLQIPTNLENANILWSIDTMTHPHLGYLPYLLILNQLNKSNKTFLIISNVHNSFANLNNQLSKDDIQMLINFNIGSIIQSDDIYYTKDYQKSLFQITRSVKIIETIEYLHKTMKTPAGIEMLRVSDLMSIIYILNDIIYFDITYILIREHETSLYQYLSTLLFNEYGRTLNILEIPMLSDLHETNQILLDITKDRIYEQLSTTQKDIIYNYFKAMIDVLYNEQTSFQEKYLSNTDIADMIDDIRGNLLLSPCVNSDPPIYVAASFLTDQFDVLRKHWKKNVNKDDKCTGTGKGIDGLQANQKGFEPLLGGKFIIINWSKKEIVYTLDLDSPAGFFIEQNYLYIANNRLNYISIIDLIRRIEIKRIDNFAFNCLHSLHRSENETLLVTSTGIDAIIQINSNGETLNDWYATEHEYKITPKGEKRNIERDFNHNEYIYPTLHQTTHINSAIILDSNYYLATLFHQGLLLQINRTNGKSKILLSGLNCPHAIKRYKSTKQNDILWMLCNTKQNELLLLNNHFQITEKMILEDVSWLQDATQIQNENIIITDANHSRIIEIDPNLNTVISEFFYSNDWRIYQISDLKDFQTNFIPTEHRDL